MDTTQLRALQQRLRTVLAGQFEVGELLGAGGFAGVFRGRDPLLNRDVAIKVFDAGLSPAAAERLLNEARLVAAIEHPHIVPLYEAGARDGLVYLVMRCFSDGSLRTRLEREKTLPPAEVVRLGTEVADALAAAHAQGVVHLDVKPDNILLDTNGHAAVTDFGIARAISETSLAPSGLSSGTAHYMSPEQVAGDRLDGRSDVYALGVVLYELVTGRAPIDGDTAQKVMANQLTQQPEALSSVAPELPQALARIITRALAKDPADRWPSARAMAEALQSAGGADQLLAPRVVRRQTRRRWYGRLGMILGGIGLGIAGLVYVVVRVIAGFSSGDPPAIDAMAPLIPPAMIDSARVLGEIPAGDSLRYIFAPHGRGLRDALFLTNRELIVLTDGRPRRWTGAQWDLTLARVSGRGYVLVRVPKQAGADTIYREVSGLEQQVLALGLRRALKTR